MIVLEGPDGGGKTTLAAWLHDYLGWRIIKNLGPPRSPEEFALRLAQYHALPGNVICDRHAMISDRIYAEAFGDRISAVTLADVGKLYARDPFIIYCSARVLPTTSTQSEAHEEKVRSHHHIIAGLYDRYFSVLPPSATFDWRAGGATLSFLLGALERWQQRGNHS